ncbi:transcriptional regulator, partial [Pseudoalteromonas piscicida]
MSKRDLFSELTTALDDAKAHSQGKLTLLTHTVNDINDLAISPDEIVNIRETFNMSR